MVVTSEVLDTTCPGSLLSNAAPESGTYALLIASLAP